MKKYSWLLTGVICLSGPAWGNSGSTSPADAHPSKSARQDYQKKVQNDLDSWSAKVDDLQAQSEKAGAETRAQLQKDIRVLKQKINVAQKKLEKLKVSTESEWDKTRASVDRAMSTLKSTYDRIAAPFK